MTDFVPPSLRQRTHEELHAAHQGVESTLRRACETVFWPGLTSEIKDLVSTCDTCNSITSKQSKEPLIPHEIPDKAWEKIATDFMTVDGQDYLVTVDRFSDYFELDRMTSKDSAAVVS